jgi:methyl-accepting chemotaxis protein
MLETINKSIVAVDEGNAQIATAAEEQSAVTRNINNNIERIADVSRKASAAAERTMIAVCSVNVAVDQLSKMANPKAG